MEHAKLTALEVERAHRSGKRLLLGDGDGLYLRKQTGNNASWVLRYRHSGRQRWFTLGNFPDMPLATARVEARQARVLLDKQQDPHGVSARSREPVSEAHKDRGPRGRLDRGRNPVVAGRADYDFAWRGGSARRTFRLRTTICADRRQSGVAALRTGGALQEVGSLPNVFQRLLDRPVSGVHLPGMCCYSTQAVIQNLGRRTELFPFVP